jgi:hypothetical protein
LSNHLDEIVKPPLKAKIALHHGWTIQSRVRVIEYHPIESMWLAATGIDAKRGFKRFCALARQSVILILILIRRCKEKLVQTRPNRVR